MITGQTSFLQALGWAVLNSLWQMALLWVVYQLVTAALKSLKPAFKSSFATVLLSLGFIWFVYTFFAALNTTDGTNAVTVSFTGIKNFLLAGWIQKILPAASILYLLLLLFPAANFIRNYRYVQVIRQYGLSKIDVQWRVFVQKTAAQMGIQKPVHIWVSEFITSPVTVGFIKPVILIPMAAVNHLSLQQMESVLLHEVSHIRRHDYLVNLVINVIRTILYFNPFVKAFTRIVEREREKSCDEMVLQFQYNSHEYATALLVLEKTKHVQPSFILSATGHRHDLLHRIELIMGVSKKRSAGSLNKLAGILAGLLCVFAFNAVFILNKKNTQKDNTAVSKNYSPAFAFLASDEMSERGKNMAPSEVAEKTAVIESSLRHLTAAALDQSELMNSIPGIINVNYQEAEIPKLDKAQEEQVKAVMDASKKVLANEEWKAVERDIADVFTQKEKELLKKSYQQELNKFDWGQWENKLRSAYDKVNWEMVNEQLNKAVNNIRIDSLQKVYSDALTQLDVARRELAANNLTGIPDTDITLKAIEEKKREVQQTLKKLKTTRAKKIVHL